MQVVTNDVPFCLVAGQAQEGLREGASRCGLTELALQCIVTSFT